MKRILSLHKGDRENKRICLNEPRKDTDIAFHITTAEWDTLNDKPVIHLHGITKLAESVVCHVNGFLPYMYFEAPIDFEDVDIPALESLLLEGAGDYLKSVKCEIVERQSVFGYSGDITSQFIKVTYNNPRAMYKLREVIETGTNTRILPRANNTFESNLDFVLRFLIDAGITGANWVQINQGAYIWTSVPTSHSKIEIEVNHENVISHDCKGDWSTIPSLKILSFDIECLGRLGVFPEPDKDSVIQIANVIKIHGSSEPCKNVIFTLGDCTPIDDAQVFAFDEERELLVAWKNFVLEHDPDIITGYNIANFDLKYLLDRAVALNISEFPFIGRMLRIASTKKTSKTTTVAFGTRENTLICIPGRIIMDLCPIMIRDHILASYSLNSVAMAFLGEPKDDVTYKEIPALQCGSNNDRARLARYCLKDAQLPMRLINKLLCVVHYIELSRVVGLPLNVLLNRGQQIRVLSQLYRYANPRGLLIPFLDSVNSEEKYHGATVLDPIVGFYQGPVATLDFNSLYPSIIQAHNLCYATYIRPENLHKYNSDDYNISPEEGHAFVKKEKCEGILPAMLTALIKARKDVKSQLKSETNPEIKEILNCRQLALKISANSVYGFPGATKGYLPCPPIAASVTAYGRNMIKETGEYVERHYTTANGYPCNAKVIYGDTDSVMIYFGPEKLVSIQKAMEFGQEAAKAITCQFINPINLEFEKVYCPYLLVGKKNYAGLHYTNSNKYDKLDVKGIECVRRDKYVFVRNVVSKVLEILLVERNIDGAVEFVKKKISELLLQEVPLTDLVYTKKFSKLEYKGKQGHVELVKRMKERDPSTAPSLGDRIAYVITAGSKGQQIHERTEDPDYVKQNKLPIDTDYYLGQLQTPLLKILTPVFGTIEKAKEAILTGEHMLRKKKIMNVPSGYKNFVTVTKRDTSVKSGRSSSSKTNPKQKQQRTVPVQSKLDIFFQSIVK